MRGRKQGYSDKLRSNVIKLFTRGLRENEVIVDNTSSTIAKELKVKTHVVNVIVTEFLDEKEKQLNERINNE